MKINKNAKKRLETSYDHAQRYLSPFFGLKPYLETEVLNRVGDALGIEHYYCDEFVHVDSVNVGLVQTLDPFIIGSSVGDDLYDLANPYIGIEFLVNMKRRFNKPEGGLKECGVEEDTYPFIALMKMVSFCCGFAYKDLVGRKGYPLDADNWVFKVAEELYSKKNHKIIKELAHLPFNEAKGMIERMLKRDIF